MKRFPKTLILACVAFASILPLIAENLYDVVNDAEKAIIQKYPNESSIAHRLAKKELEDIVFSDKTEEEKIAAIRAKYLATSVPTLPIPPESAQLSNPAQLIYRPPLQWSIHSIEISYDVDSSTNILLSMEKLYQEEERKNRDYSTGGSTTQTSSNGNRTQDEISAGGNIQPLSSLNPLKWLQARAGYQWIKTDNSSKDTTSTSSSQWNERAQRALSTLYEEKVSILQNTNIKNCHLTFSVSFKNNTDSVLVYAPQDVRIPIYAGNDHLTDAVPDTTLRAVRIYSNASSDQLFRAELNTTSALNLIAYMRFHEPLIRLDRGQVQIASEDGKVENAVQETLQVPTVPVHCRDWDFELQIRKYNQGRTTTVADAMRAINAVFEKAPFVFDNSGNCVSLMDIPLEKQGGQKVNLKRLPVISFNGSIVSTQIPSSTLGRPLLEDGLSLDVVDIVSDEEIENVWENAPTQLQEHYVSYLKPVAEKGDGQAQNILAMCYYDGHGVKKDHAEAFRWFLKSAEKGILDSIGMIGQCYEYGNGVTQDAIEAARWYRKAAEQGHSRSQMTLGLFYLYGEGVKKDEEEAVKWFLKSAEQGYMYAQWILGDCYEMGIGVIKNNEEAEKWYQKAAIQGYALAQESLGILKLNNKYYSEAVEWYRKAAEQGLDNAQYNLGVFYEKGYGVKQDYAEAVKWYRKAAEQGLDNAQYNLGVLYYSGKGVEQDYAEAAKWYRKAAEQGSAMAQCSLGFLCGHGEGVELDKAEAVKWYRKAAEQGYANAQYNLGVCYDNGEGVELDKAEAVKWYRMAANQGHEDAKKALKDLGY